MVLVALLAVLLITTGCSQSGGRGDGMDHGSQDVGNTDSGGFDAGIEDAEGGDSGSSARDANGSDGDGGGDLLDAALLDVGMPTDGGTWDGSSHDGAVSDAGLGQDASFAGFEHCPPASAYVGDSAWGGVLRSDGEMFCVFPRMYESEATARSRKRRVKVVAGDYRFPLSAVDAPFRLPSCLERKDQGAPPEIEEGVVTTIRSVGFEDPTERYYVSGRMPVTGIGAFLEFDFKADIEDAEVDLRETASDLRRSMRLCSSSECRDDQDLLLLPCRLKENTCDMFDFEGGSIAIGQMHWAGSVGAGFAAGLRVQGELDGAPVSVDDYEGITVTYGHHAFSRGLTVFFENPVGDACGLRIEEISEGSTSSIELIDCSGLAVDVRSVIGQQHRWHQPCDP